MRKCCTHWKAQPLEPLHPEDPHARLAQRRLLRCSRAAQGTLEPKYKPRVGIEWCPCAGPPRSGKPSGTVIPPTWTLGSRSRAATAQVGGVPLIIIPVRIASEDLNTAPRIAPPDAPLLPLPDLRRDLRNRRRRLPRRLHRLWDRRILQRLQRLPAWRAARCIALYHAADGEVDPWMLAARARQSGKTVVLPRLHHHTPFWMDFVPCGAGTVLKRNRFGIAEPVGRVLRPIWRIDLVLMPLVGFDRHGGRLGMGSGYYDRRFAFKRHRPALPPRLLGLAYGFQEIAQLPARPWDIPLSDVVTEQGLIRCHPRRGNP